MPQIAAYPPTQVQPDAAGPPVQPPVLPGIAHVKHPGQILRRDAHAAVPDAQIVSLPVDPDGPVLPGVLQGIAQQLLHHKGQPLAVRHRLPFHWRVIQRDAPVNELPGEPPHSGAHHIIHGARSYHVVAAALLQPQIGQRHVHVCSTRPSSVISRRAAGVSSPCRVRRIAAMGVLIWCTHAV